MRRAVARNLQLVILAGFASAPNILQAESIPIMARVPAKFPEPALLRKMLLGPFEGRGGPMLAAALTQQMAQPGPDGPPYFTIVDHATSAAGVGILSGEVTLDVSQVGFTQQESRCIDGSFFKCRQRAQVTVSCIQRTATALVNVKITRASDRKIVYAASKPYRDVSTSCEGGSPAPDVDASFQASSGQIAQQILQEIAPSSVTYKVHLLGDTKGLSKDAANSFKAAMKTATRDLVSSCSAWRALASKGEASASLSFAIGVCGEQSGDLAAAGQAYAQAATLLPGNKNVAEAVARVRTLLAARAAAAAQSAERSRMEEAERREMAAAERSAAAASRQRARLQREGESALKRRQALPVGKRVEVKAAETGRSGGVRKGMTAAQVRASVGHGCRIETLAPGEEQWFCGGQRIVFSHGHVTFVR